MSFERSYGFTGLNEASNITEVIRHFCQGFPELTLPFFNQLTRISAKTICSKLATCAPPDYFKPNDNIPSDFHFHWCTTCFAGKYGAELNVFHYELLIGEIRKIPGQEYADLADLLEGKRYRLTLKSILKILTYHRDIFLCLAPFYSKIFQVINLQDFINQIPNYDYTVYALLDPDNVLKSIRSIFRQIPFQDKMHVLESLIESRNLKLQLKFQELLNRVLYTMPSIPNLGQATITNTSLSSLEHFIDIYVRPATAILESFRLQESMEYCQNIPELFVVTFFMCIDKLIYNLPIVQQCIEVSKRFFWVVNPVIQIFISSIENDMVLIDTINKITGQFIDFAFLEKYSIPYHIQDFLTSINYDSISFLHNFISFSQIDPSIDYCFLLIYYLYRNVLTSFSANTVNMLINNLAKSEIKQSMLTDLFSLIFVKDSNDNFVIHLDIVIQLLVIIKKHTKDPTLLKYVTHARHKFNCIGDHLTDLREAFVPSESLVYSAIRSRQWSSAKSLITLSGASSSFIDLFEAIDIYRETGEMLTDDPRINYELGLSLESEFDRLKKVINFQYQSIVLNRIRINNSLYIHETKESDIEIARQFDSIFRIPDCEYSAFETTNSHELLDGYLEYINMNIKAGATNTALFQERKYESTLDFFIGTNQFDLAFEFAALTNKDINHYFSSRYHETHMIYKILAPSFPLVCFTLALTTNELEDNKDLILSRIQISKPIQKLVDNGLKGERIVEDKQIDLRKMIIEKDPQIDDYLFTRSDEILQVLLAEYKTLSIKLTSRLFDIVLCFAKNDSGRKIHEMLSFFSTFQEYDLTYNQINENAQMMITKLIKDNDFKSARTYSDYTNNTEYFIRQISAIITSYMVLDIDLADIIDACKGVMNSIFIKLSTTLSESQKYALVSASHELQISNASFYQPLTIFYALPEDKRPNHKSMRAIFDLLLDRHLFKDIKELFKQFPSFDFSSLFPALDNKLNLYYYDMLIYSFDFFSEFITQIDSLSSLYFKHFVRLFSMKERINSVESELDFACHSSSLRKILDKIGDHENFSFDFELLYSFSIESFYSRFHVSYDLDSFNDESQLSKLFQISLDNDFKDIAMRLSTKSSILNEMVESHYFFLELQLHRFSEARKSYHRSFSIDQIVHVFEFPLLIDYNWVENLNANNYPEPIYVSVRKKISRRQITENEIRYYLMQRNDPVHMIEYLSKTGNFELAFIELEQIDFDPQTFFHNFYVPLLTYGHFESFIKFIRIHDPYLERTDACLTLIKQYLEAKDVKTMVYFIYIIMNEYSKAIKLFGEFYAQEKYKEKREILLQQILNDIPPEVKDLSVVRLQQEFDEIVKTNKLVIPADAHMFGSKVQKVIVILLTNKIYPFAIKIAKELSVNPTRALTKMYTMAKKSVIRGFIRDFERYADTVTFQAWVTVLFQIVNNDNPKLARQLITSDINDDIFKCNLFIQFGHTEDALNYAKKRHLIQFIELLSC